MIQHEILNDERNECMYSPLTTPANVVRYQTSDPSRLETFVVVTNNKRPNRNDRQLVEDCHTRTPILDISLATLPI
jgi:hypothetical protein